jgi:predicted protein tyrosine phosphatase
VPASPIELAPFRLSICGIGELPEHCAVGVTHVVSILDPEWPDPQDFAAFAPHRRIALRFHDIIEAMPGYVAPQRQDVGTLLGFGRELDGAAAAHLLIHCHAGISRSTAAAILLLAQARPDLDPDALFAAVAQMRPRAWPNLRLLEFGDELLGRNGGIVAAAGPFYRRAIEREPIVAEFYIEGGRGREVRAAYGR